MTHRKVSVMDETTRSELGRAQIAWGEVSVVEKIVGYKKVKFHTHENTGYGDVRLPDLQLHTTSFWLTVPEALLGELGLGRAADIDALRGLGRALETVATLALMCDPRDLGQTLDDQDGEGDVASSHGFAPTVFLFDNVPGGVGLAERIYEQADELVARAGRLLTACPCSNGCPLCVGPTQAEASPRKRGAIRLVELVLGERRAS
jgi:DEAD/DEAH box helicase domain-containing protein